MVTVTPPLSVKLSTPKGLVHFQRLKEVSRVGHADAVAPDSSCSSTRLYFYHSVSSRHPQERLVNCPPHLEPRSATGMTTASINVEGRGQWFSQVRVELLLRYARLRRTKLGLMPADSIECRGQFVK